LAQNDTVENHVQERSMMASILDISVKATRIHKIRGQAPALSKKGNKIVSQKVVCFLLMMIFACSYFNAWMVIFGTTAVPGPKLLNGVIFGVAESFSCLTSGLIVRFIKDSTAVIICSAIGIISASVFYATGGMETGVLGAVILFIEVFA
jgi:hypothetical protein